jgi:uncharacterized protein YjbJ (UPF0337 family)
MAQHRRASRVCRLRAVPHSLCKEYQTMDKDRVKGTVKQVEGTVKEQLGKLTGNTSLEVEGKIEKTEGKVQKAFGEAKDALRSDD